MGSNYKPKTLTKPNIHFVEDALNEEKYMKSVGVRAIEELFKSAKKEGINLVLS